MDMEEETSGWSANKMFSVAAELRELSFRLRIKAIRKVYASCHVSYRKPRRPGGRPPLPSVDRLN